MTRPVRLQLSRRKGSSLQALSLATNGLPAVNCGRPSRYGNPYVVGGRYIIYDLNTITLIESKEQAIEAFRYHLLQLHRHRYCFFWADALPFLRGKNLACWCKPGEPCHADVLLEFANKGLPKPCSHGTIGRCIICEEHDHGD